jgi:ribosomal protein S27AE
MPLPLDVYNRLLAFVTEKVGRIRPCPVCGQDANFQLLNGVVNLIFADSTASFAIGPNYATHLVLICGKCGNTNLLNVNILGAMDILNGPVDAVVQTELDKLIQGDTSG